MSKVFVCECQNYEDDAKKSIDNIINTFSSLKGISKKKVIIKANLVSAMAPEKAVTTNYQLIKYLTDYLLSKDCEVTIGDSPGGVFTKPFLNHVYEVSKMTDTGAKLNNNFSTKKIFNEKAKVLKSFEYTAYLDDYDYIINFSKLKTHAMMGMSAAVKNMFGTIPGTMKPEYHYRFPKQNDFADMLIDLNEYFKADINIVDGVIGMEGNGPTMGDARKIGCILASENPYALDYICSKIINIDYQNVATITQSIERKLFDKDKVELNIDIDKLIIKDFVLNKPANSVEFWKDTKNIFVKSISKLLPHFLSSKPVVKKKKCVGCKKCANICPMKAIEMYNNIPKIDRKKCIKCFCCQEFCPKGAMVSKSSFILKFLHIRKR